MFNRILKKAAAIGLAAIMVATGINVAPKAEAAEVDYHAYFGVQAQGSWVFRNGFDDATYGKGSEAFENGLWDTEEMLDGESARPGVVVDDDIDSLNGTYTVECTGFNFNDAKVTAEAFNMIFVSTDIPTGTVEVTDAKLYFDGVEVNKGNFTLANEACVKVEFINIYNADLGKFGYTFPKESIKMEITIKEVSKVEAPGAVKKVTAKNAKAKTAKLTWKKVKGADGYVVYRADKKGGEMKEVATVKAPKYTDKKLKKGKTYYYEVKAYAADGDAKLEGEAATAKVKIKK